MDKKIALTGHTGLVGRSIALAFEKTVGFSRANGYDIRSDREKIIAAAMHCDVFVNCAHGGPGFAQTEMFWDIFNIWRDDPTKYIINIGSDSADISMWNLVRDRYSSEKSALLSAVESAQRMPHACKVSVINPNVCTPAVLDDLIALINFCICSKSEIKNVNLQ